MAIVGSPKRLAQDLAEGYFTLSPPMIKLYSPDEIKIILANIAIVGRDLRQEKIPLEDVTALKQRNMKLSRLAQVEMVIRAYCKKKRIVA